MKLLFFVSLAVLASTAHAVCEDEQSDLEKCIQQSYNKQQQNTCSRCLNKIIDALNFATITDGGGGNGGSRLVRLLANGDGFCSKTKDIYGNVCSEIYDCRSCQLCWAEAYNYLNCGAQENEKCDIKCIPADIDALACARELRSQCLCALVRSGDVDCFRDTFSKECTTPDVSFTRDQYRRQTRRQYFNFCRRGNDNLETTP